MFIKEWKDCYVLCDDQRLTIGNAAIERRYLIHGGQFIPAAILNKKTGHTWQGNQEDYIVPSISFLSAAETTMDLAVSIEDHDGLSHSFMKASITMVQGDRNIIWELMVFPSSEGLTIPFITSNIRLFATTPVTMTSIEPSSVPTAPEGLHFIPSDADCIDCVSLPDGHYKFEAVRLYDRTDNHDTLVKVDSQMLYKNEPYQAEGNLFFIHDYVRDEALMLVKEAPTHMASLGRSTGDLHIDGKKSVQMIGSGLDGAVIDAEGIFSYSSTVGVGGRQELDGLYLDFYRQQYKGESCRHTFTMSNTWGDQSQDSAICHDFMMREIEIAASIGLDIVQIDDGWQKGITANSKLVKGGVWEGYYANDPNFWDINEVKFPQGLAPIVDYAASKGITMGLWFSPDSSRDFANWKRDVETLRHLYEQYNIRYFKLDGVKLRNKTCERNYLRFLEELHAISHGQISFNQDITAEIRLGYVYHKQYGTLFAENRYTGSTSYYPHNTLKNLWHLSEYFPVTRFQFELLNNRRNVDKYGDDPLAPSQYTIDYEFATVMLANPLFWMEMRNLTPEDIATLHSIVSVYKQYRKEFFQARIRPIGQMPDGVSFPGFQIECGPDHGYLLCFREYTVNPQYTYALRDLQGHRLKATVLYSGLSESDRSASIQINDDEMPSLTVTMKLPRSYMLIQYQDEE